MLFIQQFDGYRIYRCDGFVVKCILQPAGQRGVGRFQQAALQDQRAAFPPYRQHMFKAILTSFFYLLRINAYFQSGNGLKTHVEILFIQRELHFEMKIDRLIEIIRYSHVSSGFSFNDTQSFMHQGHGLNGHFVAIGLEVGGLYLRRPCFRQGPGDDRLMLFVQQFDIDVTPELFLALLEHEGFFPELEIFEISEESAPLERDIAVLGHARLFGFVIQGAAAFAVFDGRGFKVQSGYFGKPHAGASPFQLKMKFGDRIIFFGIVCHKDLFKVKNSFYLHRVAGSTALMAISRLFLQASNASRFILALLRSVVSVRSEALSASTQDCTSALKLLLQMGKSNVGISSQSGLQSAVVVVVPDPPEVCVVVVLVVVESEQGVSQAKALYHSQITVLKP